MSDDFEVKDSGAREEYDNGFVRDTEAGKHDYARILRIEGLDLVPIEMLERLAAHMTKGAEKYGPDNWRRARGPIAVARFCRSLVRHVRQFLLNERDEDHAAAVTFNVWAAELTRSRETQTLGGALSDTRLLPAYEPVVIRRGDPEPDRGYEYRDSDGDVWRYVVNAARGAGWVFRNYVYSWDEVQRDYFYYVGGTYVWRRAS